MKKSKGGGPEYTSTVPGYPKFILRRHRNSRGRDRGGDAEQGATRALACPAGVRLFCNPRYGDETEGIAAVA